MVLDHSVSLSFENSRSRTQTVKGGRCVYEQRHVGMRQSCLLRQTCQPAALPPKPSKMIVYNAVRKIYPETRFKGLVCFLILSCFSFFADIRADKSCNRYLAGVLYYSDEEVEVLDA